MSSKLEPILKLKKDKEKKIQIKITNIKSEISDIQKCIVMIRDKIKNISNKKTVSAYELKLIYIYKNNLQKELNNHNGNLFILKKRLEKENKKLQELQIEILKYEKIIKREKERKIAEEKRKELNLIDDFNNIISSRKNII